jgi:hypothetical protein
MLAVQRQMQRMQEWRLALLQHRENELHDEERSLIASLNADDPLHGLFVHTIAKRLSSVGKETAVVDKAKKTQAEILLTETRKLKHVERMEAVASTSEGRAGEKRRLEDAIGEAMIRMGYGTAAGRRES